MALAIYLIPSNNNLMKSNNAASALPDQIAAIRSFSRFYTRKLGIIEPKLLDSPFTLQEALQRRQIITRKPSKDDGRVNEIALTAKGRTASAELERRSRAEVGALLA